MLSLAALKIGLAGFRAPWLSPFGVRGFFFVSPVFLSPPRYSGSSWQAEQSAKKTIAATYIIFFIFILFSVLEHSNYSVDGFCAELPAKSLLRYRFASRNDSAFGAPEQHGHLQRLAAEFDE